MKTTDEKTHQLQVFIFKVSQYFELIVAMIIIIAILMTFTSVPSQLLAMFRSGGFNDFLKYMFNIIIGIELLKMLCRHDLDSVVEVLLFAVARGMIIEHMPILETLIGIVAIAILFLIRKYLFVSALDQKDDD